MTGDVVISAAGAMPGDGRQRAEEQKLKYDKKEVKTINWLPSGSAWYLYEKPKQNRKSIILPDCVLGVFVV